MILLDTDICLSLFFGKITPEYILKGSIEEVCIASITVEELYRHAKRSSDVEGNSLLIDQFLLTVRVLFPELATLKLMADVRHVLQKKGKTISTEDLTVYALSKTHGAKLITTMGKRYCFT